MNNFSSETSLWSNTVSTFKRVIGYELSNLRVVFEHDGDEIVYINESLIGRVRVYLNGSLAYSGWDYTGMINSSGWFLHKGKTYRVRSKISNLLSFAQTLTLAVDDDIVDAKTDAFWGKLTLKEIGRLALGATILGLLLGLFLSALGV